jgi:hypothetical protein
LYARGGFPFALEQFDADFPAPAMDRASEQAPAEIPGGARVA